MDHLCVHCPYMLKVWSNCQELLCFNVSWNSWNQPTLNINLLHWFNSSPVYPELPFFLLWEVWKNRNRSVFDHKSCSASQVAYWTCAWVKDYCCIRRRGTTSHLKYPVFDPCCSVGYFDGAQKDLMCGAGMVIHIKRGHSLRLWIRAGHGTNTQAELLALWDLLWCANPRGIQFLQVVGDSSVIINWILGISDLHVLHLKHWMCRILELKGGFSYISFKHIFIGSSTGKLIVCPN